ncbi:MAG: 2-oxoglutarate dehydrogenase complex dihydrolipoyllysine-residue succinyltransferase [Deltaproteobacteria bacterium]|nr:2-oxoglutarate dehydrogenase complex dihydrolipoyllysine-residue succinyltransferase [Deltaproteobacteria bacterium]
MLIEIKVPSVGESVTEALLAQWFKNEGDLVKKDEPLFVIETDKVTLEVVAEAEGVLSIKVAEGEIAAIGAVVGTLDSAGAAQAAAAPVVPSPQDAQADAPAPAETAEPASSSPAPVMEKTVRPSGSELQLAPSVRRLVAEKNLDPAIIQGTGPGGRLTKGDVVLYLESRPSTRSTGVPDQAAVPAAVNAAAQMAPPETITAEELISRKPMSPIRQRIAARLLEAKHSTAMLTTFNEIDMANLMAIRKQCKERFRQKHGVNLGMMSFFIKAGVEALQEQPQINAFIDGKDFIEHHYYHIGVAVGSERGLVVPVIRHADKLSFAGLEQAIVDYVKKIQENRLELADLEGGTFTISNGGVYGSLLSTPILNTPQSAILGMHKIEKRPVVIDDEIVIRPMMYVALSYDHRIVDGREAVTFLKRIKEFVENPERMILEI